MPRNGTGTFSRTNGTATGTTVWTDDKNAARKIRADLHDTHDQDIADALTASIAKDGQTTTSARIPFAFGFSTMDGTVAAPGWIFTGDADTGFYRIAADNIGVACAGAKVLDIGTAGLGIIGTTTGTSSNANALAIGRQGATSPAIKVDASTASSATGVEVVAKAAGNGVALRAISSGTNDAFDLDAKGTGQVRIGTNSTGSVRVDRALDISNGGGGQIVFPASQNASSNANTLDDYEEGTWTPVLTFATAGNLNVVYSTQVGVYTKIGRLVNVIFSVNTSTFTHTSASGNCQITGFPFAAAAPGSMNPASFQGITKANYTSVAAFIAASATLCTFLASGSAQSVDFVTTANMPTGGSVQLFASLTYIV